MLVTIAIISLLSGLLLTAIVGTRKLAREAKCRSNLRQIATALELYRNSYGEGVYLPPWLTWLRQYPPEQPMLGDDSIFICPEDFSQGQQGGRPDHLYFKTGQEAGQQIPQYENADIDRGDLLGHADPGVKIPCSYLFEMNAEPCEWVYADGGQLSVPFGDEFEWENVPTVEQLFDRANVDSVGVLSWYEVKLLTIQGWPGYLRGYGSRVPILRCFWHASEPFLEDNDWVLNIRYDFAVYKGHPRWAHDAAE